MFSTDMTSFQAVEFFGEWSLCPQNVVFLRVQTSVFDPLLIGDKPKWYAQQLQPIDFKVYDDNSSLSAALSMATDILSDDFPTGIWAASWQNQQNYYTPTEDSDQPDQSLRCALNG